MNEEMLQIAARIRELREVCGYTAEEMARELGVGLEVYHEYETAGENIPISVLYHISQKFRVDMTEILTGRPARLNTYEVCKRGSGKEIDRYPGYKFEGLASKFMHKVMEPLLVTVDPSDEEAALVTHGGQEFNLVLEGTIIITYDDKKLTLNEGDAIYFDPTHPHGQKAAGNKKARFLTVITE